MPHPGCSDGVHSDKQLQPLRQSEWGKKREKEKKGKLKQISKEFCKKKKINLITAKIQGRRSEAG